MAQPPSYDASNNPSYQGAPPAYPPPQDGAYPPPVAYPPPQQGGAYPPPVQGGAYPPPQGGAYPPPQQGGYAAPPPSEPYHYPNKQGADADVEYQGAGNNDGTMGIINFDNKSIRLSEYFII